MAFVLRTRNSSRPFRNLQSNRLCTDQTTFFPNNLAETTHTHKEGGLCGLRTSKFLTFFKTRIKSTGVPKINNASLNFLNRICQNLEGRINSTLREPSGSLPSSKKRQAIFEG